MNNYSENNDKNSFQKIAQSAPIGLLTFSADWEIQYVNDNFLQFGILYGFNLNIFIGSNILENSLIQEINLTEELEKLKDGLDFEKEIRNIKTSDGKISVILKATSLFENNKFAGGILVVEDLRTFNRKDEKKTLSAEDFETVISKINDFLFVTDKEGNVKYSFGKNLGKLKFSYDDIEIKHITVNFSTRSSVDFSDKIRTVKEKRTSAELNVEFFFENETKNFACKIEPLINKHGQIDFIFIWLNDISSLIQKTEDLKNELKDSEKRLSDLFSKTDELICVTDPSGKIIYSNEKFIETLRFTKEELINRNIKNFIEPHFLREKSFSLNNFAEENSGRIKLPLISKMGRKFIFSSNITPVYDEENNLKYFNCFFLDITNEKNIKDDFALLDSLFNFSYDGIVLEFNGKILKANSSFAKIFGYEEVEELIGKEFLNLSASSDVLKVAEYLQLIKQKKSFPSRFEFLGRKKDGFNFFAEISTSLFEIETKHYSVITLRDVTEGKKAQQNIKESEEKYRNIIENIDDFLYTFERINKTLRPVFYTASVEKITGYKYQDFLNDSKLYLKIIHPDDLQQVKSILKRLLKSRIQFSEEFEFRIINKHGNVIWIRNKINLVRNNDGKIQKIYGLVSDISLRKKAEKDLIKSTENLVKINETKDKFISIISHDLRTPFSSILGFTDLILNDNDLSENEKTQYIKYIQDSSNSMLSLVNSLLDWTRLQTGRIKFEPGRTEISKIIARSINSISGAAVQKNIYLTSEVKDNIFVFVDKDLVGQVFNNLISNSIKFTNAGGKIIISSKPSEQFRFIEFSVKDNGVGIKEENLNQLFNVESKFTSDGTKGEKGSGLGLSLVKEIIEKHGGELWVESEYRKGSEFKFTLPIASADILLVDDSQTDKLLYSKILLNITPGYNVETASNGKEALEKIKKAPPALIITDYQMPEMNGYEFVFELQRLNLKTTPPVIVLSSNIDRSTIDDYRQLGIEFVFKKPVNLSIFKQAVEKSLKKGLR